MRKKIEKIPEDVVIIKREKPIVVEQPKEIEVPKRDFKQLPKIEERVEKFDREDYQRNMNKVYEPNGFKLVDKEDLDKFFSIMKRKTLWNIIFGAIALVFCILLVINIFWFNMSIKDGKLQSTFNVNNPVYVNSTTYNPVDNKFQTNITIINNIQGYAQNCSQMIPDTFDGITITNATIIDSLIVDSVIINSSLNNTY